MIKYYYIYKIVCLEGKWKGCYYYGKHETYDLNDNYFASGKKINDYRKKYPNSYTREIVLFCKTRKELNKAEYDIIHPCLLDPLCLNIAEGGHGYPLENLTEQEKQNIFDKISKSNKNKVHVNNGIFSKMIDADKLNIYLEKGWNKGRIKDYITDEYIYKQKCAQTGKNHTEEYKQRMSKLKWIHKGETITRVWEHQLNNYINNGWSLGKKD